MEIMISVRIIIAMFLFSMAGICSNAFSQQNGSSAGSTGNNTGANATPAARRDPPMLIPSVPTPSSLPPKEIQPIFISGNVMQEDGSFPPDGSIIEMDCGWKKTREAAVSPNGRFSFQYGGSRRFREIVPDASESNFLTKDDDQIYWSPTEKDGTSSANRLSSLNMKLSGCDLRAQLSGYRSSSIRLNGTMLTTVNEVGSIVIYPLDRIRGASVSAANLLAPKKAKSLLNQARKAIRKSKYEEAENLMKAAIELYPQYVDAWVDMGVFYQQQKRRNEAEEALKKAEQIDRLFVRPHVQMCWFLAGEKRWSELADKAEQTLTLDPVSFPDLYYLSAMAHYNLRDLDQAEKRAGQAKLRDTLHQYPQVHIILANIYESKHSLMLAKEELRNYLLYAPQDVSNVAQIRKRLEKVTEKAALGPKAP
jgi:tetratricopeptide (TPR) repeat protein